LKDKLSFRDFPPTKENEKMRMWDIKNLSIDIDKKGIDEFTMIIEVDDGEKIYESRVYTIGQDVLKMLSKTRPDGKIWTMLKFEDGHGIFKSKGWVTEEEFRKEVGMVEAFLYPWNNLVVTDGEKMENIEKMMEKMVKEYEKEVE